MFVCLGFGRNFILFVYLFPKIRSSKGPRMGPLLGLKMKVNTLPTPLRGCRSLLEIVFCRTV